MIASIHRHFTYTLHTPHQHTHNLPDRHSICLSSHIYCSCLCLLLYLLVLSSVLTSHLHLVWFDLSPTNPPASVSREIGVTNQGGKETQRRARRVSFGVDMLKIHHRTITDTPLWPPEPRRFSRPQSGYNYCGLVAGHNRRQHFSRNPRWMKLRILFDHRENNLL